MRVPRYVSAGPSENARPLVGTCMFRARVCLPVLCAVLFPFVPSRTQSLRVGHTATAIWMNFENDFAVSLVYDIIGGVAIDFHVHAVGERQRDE